MGDKTPFIDEDEGLMNGSNTQKSKGYDDEERFCVRHWKVIFAGTGVFLLITLGVIIGAVFNRNDVGELGRGARSNEFPYKDIRLPGNVKPLRYQVYLHPNITNKKDFSFTGFVNILVRADNDSVSDILLHSKDLKIEKVNLYEIPKGTVGDIISKADTLGKEVTYKDYLADNKKNEMLMIRLQDGDTLDSKLVYVVHIKFKGKLSTGLEGFYLSSYKKKGQKEPTYLATTHFEATAARKAFPCFDEPAMKANFSIIMVKEKQHKALSNMPIDHTEDRIDGLEVVYFKESVKMSTYLVAFVVCDYSFKEAKTPRGTTVKVWAPKDQIEQANFAIEVAPKVLSYYEEYFKVNFPLPKQDLIAIPDFAAGAMENWGLITYRLTSILYDEKESSSSNKQWVAVVIAHELAHQWFGNLVTMKWWNDLWLNEGFAAFTEFIGANHTDPSWQMMDQFIVDDVQSSMVLDSHLNSHPISVEVKDPSQINEIFDTISYDKGASIIRMMKHFLGSNVFHTGLQNYLKKFQFSNAVSDDLWQCLSKASNQSGRAIDVKAIMDTWTTQMGYPVITAKRENETFQVTQQHFIVDQDYDESKLKDSKWKVPLTYYTEKVKTPKLVWMDTEDEIVAFDAAKAEGWIKMNVDQKGFYRVNYEEENWKALSNQLVKDHKVLSTSDRSNLIDDAFELAKANLLDQVKALDMTAYLSNEKEYVPWVTAMSSLGYIGAMLEGSDQFPDAYKLYEQYIVAQVHPIVKRLKWEDKGSHLDKYLRGSALRLAVSHGDKEAIKKGKELFNKWKDSKGKDSIPPNLRSAVYLAAIKYGGQEEWNYMYNEFRTTSFPSEERKLMFALADTQDQKQLEKYLKMSMDNKIIRSQDTCSVIEHIAGNPKGRELAYNFVEKNWDTLFERYGTGSFDMSRLVKAVFGRYKTKAKLEKVKKFLGSHKMGSGKLASKQAIAAVKNHIAWLKKNGKKVESWLKKQVQKQSRRSMIM
ncbi:glutamyl aminopeptidase-like isoform X1 [Clytia hemisphaerica]|uniref:Aminopeptidase n=1 Tax=Clytia hemisphaerica TaxID=252671 RepID=A0A7M5UZX1_9CNID